MIEKTITIKATKNWQRKPTKPGMYLMRTDDVKEKIVLVYKGLFGLTTMNERGVGDMVDDDKFTNCKWFGPIKNS